MGIIRMHAEEEDVIEAAGNAVKEAIENSNAKCPLLIIPMICCARFALLKDKQSELNQIKKVLREKIGTDNVPIIGFYTYAEQGAPEWERPMQVNQTLNCIVFGDKLISQS